MKLLSHTLVYTSLYFEFTLSQTHLSVSQFLFMVGVLWWGVRSVGCFHWKPPLCFPAMGKEAKLWFGFYNKFFGNVGLGYGVGINTSSN